MYYGIRLNDFYRKGSLKLFMTEVVVLHVLLQQPYCVHFPVPHIITG